MVPPTSFMTPTSASLIPSTTPSAAAEAPSVPVRNVGSTDVVTSWPASEKKLDAPMAPTPGLSHFRLGAWVTRLLQSLDVVL